MKKCLLTFLLFALTPIMSFGVGPLTSVVKTAETEQTLDKLIDPQLINAMARRLAQSYPEHREELQKFIFDKEREFDRAGEMEITNKLYVGLTKFYFLLAGKVFNEIKERELDRIQKYSQFTGRKIRKAGDYQWLDMGEYMESDACRLVDDEKCRGRNKTFECYANEAQKWCDYPDGFESYVLSIKSDPLKDNRYKNYRTIELSRDNKAENKHYKLSVTFVAGAYVGNGRAFDETSFEYRECTTDYTAEADYRNRWRQAQRNGAYLKGTYCSWGDTKTDPKCKDIINKDLKDFYPNGNNYGPGYHCMGEYDRVSTLVENSREGELNDTKGFEIEQDALFKMAGFKVD